MTPLKKGKRVKIIIGKDIGKFGKIVKEGDPPHQLEIRIKKYGEEKEEVIIKSWWKVRLDGTGEEKDFSEDKLQMTW